MTTETAAVLEVQDHRRDFSGLTYVYPVISRRAGGVSVGINLNPNNACNWHCAYCQVPNLARGEAPPIDLAVLERELRQLLAELASGRFMERHVPEGWREVRDIAISGNGEPTSSRQFALVVSLLGRLRDEAGLATIPVRLITNGSLVGRAYVQEGLRRLARLGGEVWFKVDAGRPEDMTRINGVSLSPQSVVKNLARSAGLCPTWVQTCLFRWDGLPPTEDAIRAYVHLLQSAGVAALKGVLLYGVARPSMQNEASHVAPLAREALECYAEFLRDAGLTVSISP
ncbi:MAG: radical SAM protein [Zoogloeaceae bacterium]|nr:radical SAM protein [Zoogloeaceae bacterium]